MAFAGLQPVEAGPLWVGPKPVVSPQIEQVQYHHRDHRGWYHGHRGYKHYRPGYRRHRDGWWYPLAAFGAGAIIGGAISGRPAVGLPSRHVHRCAAHYRTYRASDNTYVPRIGVRAVCHSPYR
ncbi:BA14K family protein [Rhizobium sp. WSM1325]|uniref:BA14K family protein n=1 Tax=Rhizobium sp. WSM1325 TaxID=3444086 RepID=UPI000FEE96B1|nr:BA14K family protein [Rhizobium leguminosarum]RWY67682.1 lectin [Rhizobium leguminosarum]